MTAPTPVQAASEAIESAPIGAPVTLPYSQAVALWSTLAAVTAERDEARQILADAPHTDICYYRQRQGDECNCWKAGL